eukprot:CAMPEP_0176091538 /NCGR_PEP_ID=MMETSP0120_2-20121206/45851_1 /TAXON_ID=160619 /ORGANISM="Kryptoperidinium foliaceum, Strain CCMP 1326" /LENGTH=840 /DNA_ID=CAMNT_0017425435 /DNA_START=1 /DNA_END=2523 /DNA_ORIENTATION=+
MGLGPGGLLVAAAAAASSTVSTSARLVATPPRLGIGLGPLGQLLPDRVEVSELQLVAKPGLVSQVLAPLDETATPPNSSAFAHSPLDVLRRGAANRTQAEIVRVRLNAQGDGRALLGSLIFSGIGALLILMLFTLLRRRAPEVYAREGASVDGTNGPKDWWALVRATSPDDEVRAAGLDAWALLEFYRLNIRIIWMIGPPILLVICPAHYVATRGSPDFLGRLDISGIPDRSAFYWMHAAFVWFVVLSVSFCVSVAHRDFLARRFRWLRSAPSPQATTVMVENIPEALRSDAALKDYFCGRDGLFMRRSEIVADAYIVRKTYQLRPMWEHLQELRRTLSLARSSRRQGHEESDAEEEEKLRQLAQDVRDQEQEVAAERMRVEAAVAVRDPSVCSSSGFVTFTSVLWQRLALKEDFRANKAEFVISAPADPSDVVYENLMADAVGSHTREWLGWLCLLGLFLGWSPVVVFISSWTTLSTIEAYVPLADDALRIASDILPFLPSLVEGVLATAALRLFLALLPDILYRIITGCFCVKSGVAAQFRLGRWYFSFLLIFVLLVTTLGRSLVVTAVALAKDPTRIIDLMAVWLPRASHYYFSYMIMGWLTLAWEMTRFANFAVYYSLTAFHGSGPKAAKHFSEPESAASYGMGARMGLASLMFAITIVFSTCSPLMLVFSLVYFSIGRMAYGYLLVHAETRKPDSGGHFWVEAMRQVCFILVLFVLLMTGVLVARFNTFWCGPAFLTLGALPAVYMLWSRLHSYEWETLPLEEMMKAWRSGDSVRSMEPDGAEQVAASPAGGACPTSPDIRATMGVGSCSGDVSQLGLQARYRQPECEPPPGAAP